MTQRFMTTELEELFDRYRLAPDSTVFAPLADACRKAGMVEEALLICARGIKAHPGYASGHVVHGKCYFDATRHGEAEASFRRVLEIDRHNLVALKFLGIIRAQSGDAAAARRFFEEILELDPEDQDIRRRLDRLEPEPATRRTPEDRPEAAASAEVEDVLEPRDIPDEDFEGETITLRDEAVTSDEIATLTLADIYAAQGHSAKALRIYREVLSRQPENEELRRKISALEQAAPPPPAAPVATIAPVVTHADDVVPAVESRARRPELPAPNSGSQIDESRSYEQFKRWLRAMS